MTSVRPNVHTAIPAPPSRKRPRASTSGYWIAAVIAALGLVVGIVWGLTAYRSYQSRIEDFPRLSDPGSVTVRIPAPGERVLYYEGSKAPTLGALDVTVTSPSGNELVVRSYEGDLRYDAPSGTVGKAIGRFAAPIDGAYRIVAGAVPAGDDNAVIAVGENVPMGTIGNILGALFVIGAALLIGAVLTVATALRRSSSRS